MQPLTIARLTSGGVITTYHCVSRCAHCLYNSSPQRSRDYLGEDHADRIFACIRKMGCRTVHIGGGEPLLAPHKLLKVLDSAHRSGIGIDYVETNAAWFVGTDEAVDLLGDLKCAGVHTLLVSISPFHNAHIPLARTKGVIDACHKVGVQVFPWVEGFMQDLEGLDQHQTHQIGDFESAFGPAYLRQIPGRYWIHWGGRALQTFRAVHLLHTLENILSNSPANCSQVLSDTTHFHIDLAGRYIPGLCAGLAIAMADLGNPLPPGHYALIDCLAGDGINGLYQLAHHDHGFVPRPEGYLNHCDLCDHIRHYLFNRSDGVFAELAPAGFYAEQL